MQLSVAEIMTPELRSIDAHDTISHAREVFELQKIHALVVVDDEGEMIGILTSSDVICEHLPRTTPVAEAMTDSVIMLDESAGPQEAARLMQLGRCHHIIIEKEGKPSGMLSAFDLLKVLASF